LGNGTVVDWGCVDYVGPEGWVDEVLLERSGKTVVAVVLISRGKLSKAFKLTMLSAHCLP